MEGRFVTHSTAETEALGCRLAEGLSGGVVALYGELGAGKTAFVRGMCRGVGYGGEVSSSTFALVHAYTGGRVELFHFDLYRIADEDELESCGFYDCCEQGLVAVEWSERLGDALPPGALTVRLAYGEQANDRVITIQKGGAAC